jgi:hypothetical protein
MKKTRINIWAYNHHAKFEIEHELDTPESIEKLILDKLGEKSIIWENLGDSYHAGLQTKKVLGVEVATGASG